MNKEFELPEFSEAEFKKWWEENYRKRSIHGNSAYGKCFNAWKAAMALVEAYKEQLATEIPAAWAVPCAKACQDGSMEEGPVQFLSADDANEYAKRVGWPLYARPMQAVAQSVAVPDEPVAEVVNKYGDPAAFAERELSINNKTLQSLPIGSKLYTRTQPPAPEQAQSNEAYCETCEHIVNGPCNSADCSMPEQAQTESTLLKPDDAFQHSIKEFLFRVGTRVISPGESFEIGWNESRNYSCKEQEARAALAKGGA